MGALNFAGDRSGDRTNFKIVHTQNNLLSPTLPYSSGTATAWFGIRYLELEHNVFTAVDGEITHPPLLYRLGWRGLATTL